MTRLSPGPSSRFDDDVDDEAIGEPRHVRPSSMRVVLVGCAFVALLTWFTRGEPPLPAAHAQAVLEAPPCVGARGELDAALAQPTPSSSEDRVRLKIQIEKQRGIVAQRCFGREADKPIAGRAAAQAAAVPPIGAGPVRAAPVPPAPAAIAPPVEVGRPTFATTCDAGGCWDNTGARLNGPPGGPLTGPRGTCTTSPAGVVNCF